MSNFSSRFKALRNNAYLTQHEIAKHLCVSQSTITMWENGKRNPDIKMLEKIADYFNVDLNYLIGSANSTTRILSEKELYINSLFYQLNDNGKDMLLSFAEDLVSSKIYSR